MQLKDNNDQPSNEEINKQPVHQPNATESIVEKTEAIANENTENNAIVSDTNKNLGEGISNGSETLDVGENSGSEGVSGVSKNSTSSKDTAEVPSKQNEVPLTDPNTGQEPSIPEIKSVALEDVPLRLHPDDMKELKDHISQQSAMAVNTVVQSLVNTVNNCLNMEQRNMEAETRLINANAASQELANKVAEQQISSEQKS